MHKLRRQGTDETAAWPAKPVHAPTAASSPIRRALHAETDYVAINGPNRIEGVPKYLIQSIGEAGSGDAPSASDRCPSQGQQRQCPGLGDYRDEVRGAVLRERGEHG